MPILGPHPWLNKSGTKTLCFNRFQRMLKAESHWSRSAVLNWALLPLRGSGEVHLATLGDILDCDK